MSGPPSRVPFRGVPSEITPGVFLVTVSGAPSEEEFEAFLKQMSTWLRGIQKNGGGASLIVDPSALTRFDAPMRKAYGEWRHENMDLIKAAAVRAAYIADSAVWRGVLTAIFWFAKPAIPVQTCADREAAERWIGEQVRR